MKVHSDFIGGKDTGIYLYRLKMDCLSCSVTDDMLRQSYSWEFCKKTSKLARE